MSEIGQITCNGEEFIDWCKNQDYEILSVETPKPGIYRFTPIERVDKGSRPQNGFSNENKVAGNAGSTPATLAPLFGNASPATPSGVVRPQDDPPKSPIPAGTLSQRIELLPAEIADFMLRVRRMEIVITGQMPHTDGRRTVFQYEDAVKYRPTQQNAPKVILAPPVAICEACQSPLEQDGTCNICAVTQRIAKQARANRRAYHEMKRGLTNANQ